MSPFLYILSCILFQISLAQVSFTEVDSTQQYYPRYKINLGSNPCGLSVCQSCIQIQCNNGITRDSNQMYGDEYAWNYADTFQPPLTFVITKSNNDKLTFTNLISDYNTYRTFPTGRQFCPTPSPTQSPVSNPTNNPSITPTKYPTKTPTKTPTNIPTKTPIETPTQSPTNNPSQPTKTPTYNPSKSPTNIPTIFPSKTPTKTPTQSPTNIPTNRPTITPTISPTRNNKGGEISETENTQATPQNNNDNQSKSSSNDIFSDNNNTLIIILGIVIGSLICCIIILLLCYFNRKKDEYNDNDTKSMELGRIMSNSIMGDGPAPGEGDATHVKIASESTEINAMLSETAPDSMQSNVHNINIIKQQSITPLTAQPIPAFNVYGDSMALKMWLNTCGVPQYYDIFVNEGFSEQLSTVVTLNDSDLQTMGVMDVMHRRAILNQIDIMKRGQLVNNNSNYEGNIHVHKDVSLPKENEYGVTVGAPEMEVEAVPGNDKDSDSESDGSNDIYGKKDENVKTSGQ